MYAVVLVSKELAIDAKYTDLEIALRYDFPVTITEFFGSPHVDLAQYNPLREV